MPHTAPANAAQASANVRSRSNSCPQQPVSRNGRKEVPNQYRKNLNKNVAKLQTNNQLAIHWGYSISSYPLRQPLRYPVTDSLLQTFV